jgi:hypothetical protein
MTKLKAIAATDTCPVCGGEDIKSEGVASDEHCQQVEEVYELSSCVCGLAWISRATVTWYETEITKGGWQ